MDTGGLAAVMIMPKDEETPAQEGPPHRTGDWLDEDVRRAIRSAEEAGLTDYRIEIAPDGTISIIVGSPSGEG